MKETMDIHASFGAKVRYANVDQHYDSELVLGEVYTVKRTKVHAYHTNVILMEFPKCLFPTVMFDGVEQG